MQTSLYTGISGLNANLSALSVIGNNVANINTNGFKSSRVLFEDVMSQSASGGSEIGLGVNLSSTQRIFSQGAFETTASGLDLAISGNGFFTLADSSGTFYSRAGAFRLDQDGYLVNPSDLNAQGYLANASGVLGNTIGNIQISNSAIAPSATTKVDVSANVDSNALITGFVFTTGSNEDIAVNDGSAFTADLITNGGLTSGTAYTGAEVATAIKNALEGTNSSTDTYTVAYAAQTGLFTITNDTGNTNSITIDWAGASTANTVLGFTADDTIAVAASGTSDVAGGAFTLASAADTSNFSVPITVYDSLGNDHVLTAYFRKDSLGGTGNVWDWYAVVDAADTTSGSTELQANGTLTFNTTGALYSDSSITYPTGGFDFIGGGAQNQTIDFDFGTSTTAGGTGKDGITQYGTDSAVSALSQDGFTAGSLQRISVNSEGLIEGVFSNGRTRTLAQLILATFQSQEGLIGVGRTLYRSTVESGPALLGNPGSSGKGLIQSSTLELANVDLASEFISMITSQRGFQANSRIITTTDDILAELVNLKR
ncbi:Flagellar hook protein FlgE [hydrothermal vent metagenome]|uniref:Flagellar hook protein FlgE n=1 Tax=hydrothermal vent metagenome TaxID=652676 RepID=A0A3B0QUC4_9ZZZZ